MAHPLYYRPVTTCKFHSLWFIWRPTLPDINVFWAYFARYSPEIKMSLIKVHILAHKYLNNVTANANLQLRLSNVDKSTNWRPRLLVHGMLLVMTGQPADWYVVGPQTYWIITSLTDNPHVHWLVKQMSRSLSNWLVAASDRVVCLN